MTDAKPMTREVIEAAELRVVRFGDGGGASLLTRGDVFFLKAALATIADREARLRRAVEACEASKRLVEAMGKDCPEGSEDMCTAAWEKCRASIAENEDLPKGESP